MSVHRNLEVVWGVLPPRYGDSGVGWSRVVGVRGNKLHLTPFEAWANTALCGKNADSPSAFASGHLCRECADVAGVVTTVTLERDPSETAWNEAHTAPAAEAVDGDPSPAAEIEPQAQPEPVEASPSVDQLVDRLTASIEAARQAQRALRRAECDLLDARTALGRLS